MVATSKELKIKYTGDVSGVKKATSEIDKAHQGLSSKLSAIGQKMTSVGKTATLGLTLPIVGAGVAAFKLADDWGDATTTLQQHIKTMGAAGSVSFDQLTQHAQSFAVKTGVAATEIVQAQGKLATFANVVKAGTDTLNRATDAAVDLSASGFGSVGSASVMLGKALDNPVKGLTALTRVGVSFSDQQAKVITHLVDTGKTAKAQGLILKAVESQVGGTAAKIADPWDKAKVALQNAAITIGTQLAPIIAKLSEYVAAALKWFQNLSPGIQHIAVVIALVVAAVGPLLIVVGKLFSAFSAITGLFAEGGALAGIAFLPWVAIIAAIVLLTIVVIKNWGTIKAFLLKVWGVIVKAWQAVWSKIRGVVLPVIHIITAYIKVQVAIWVGIFKLLWPVVKVVWNVIKVVVGTVIRVITGIIRAEWAVWKAIFLAVKGFVLGVWHTIHDVAVTVWRGIGDVVKGVWDGIVSAVKSAANFMIGILNKVISATNTVINGVNKLPGPDLPTIQPVPTLARGGTIKQAGLAIVGERGAEMVSLPRGATVHPHGTGPGAGTVNIYVAGSVLTERDLADVVQRALLRKQQRNGTLGLT